MSTTIPATVATQSSSEQNTSLPCWSFVPKLERNEPEAVARSLLECIGIGIESIIQAGEISHFALSAYLPGSSERSRFFNPLVEAGFLSKSEARAEGQSPKISKLGTIGQYGSVLRTPEIKARLSPGYSTCYAAVQLFKEIETPDPIATMIDLLKKANGDANREFLGQQVKELKRAKANQAATQRRSVSVPAENLDAGATKKAELVYLTPTVKDNKRFLHEYAEPDALSISYRVHELVAEIAVAVCVTELRNYPVVADVILPYSGFKYMKKVYLLERPSSAEVSEAKIAIVATKAHAHELPIINDPWESESRDGKALADRLAPDASARLHVFADEPTSGWQCLTSDAAWAEMPSLQGVS